MAIYTPYHMALFWSKVDVQCGLEPCWPWKAGKNQKGYGRFKHNGLVKKAHRVAWEMFNSELLGERLARHQCDNPECCNPFHIVPGSAQDNVNDMMERGRNKPHAPGEFSGAKNPRALLSNKDVAEIRSRISLGHSDHEIAQDYPVTDGAIYSIRTGKSWRSVQ